MVTDSHSECVKPRQSGGGSGKPMVQFVHYEKVIYLRRWPCYLPVRRPHCQGLNRCLHAAEPRAGVSAKTAPCWSSRPTSPHIWQLGGRDFLVQLSLAQPMMKQRFLR